MMDGLNPIKTGNHITPYKMLGLAVVLVRIHTHMASNEKRYLEFGPIIDLCRDGLIVRYIESKKRAKNYSELAISIPVEGIKVDQIQFKTITDFKVITLPNRQTIRQRLIQFQNTNAHQAHKIDDIVHHFYRISIPEDASPSCDGKSQFGVGSSLLKSKWCMFLDQKSSEYWKKYVAIPNSLRKNSVKKK